jgi:putative endonuclease
MKRNYRSPGRGGGEIDLIMMEADGTLVFVEVRFRRTVNYGGAGASITRRKMRRIIWAARHYISRIVPEPVCRFDVVSLRPNAIEWIKSAMDASDWV